MSQKVNGSDAHRVSSVRYLMGWLLWLLIVSGLFAIGYREHREKRQFLEAVNEISRVESNYDIKPNPYDQPERPSYLHVSPYISAAIGAAGLAAILTLLIIARDRVAGLLGTAVLWQALPTAFWLYSAWDGPSKFFTSSEIAAIVVVPIACGVIQRSWKLAALTFSLPIITAGLMWGGFIVIMGDGR